MDLFALESVFVFWCNVQNTFYQNRPIEKTVYISNL